MDLESEKYHMSNELETIRILPLEDSGILPTSKMYLHLPSETAKSNLFYAPYAGHFHVTPFYSISRENYEYYLFISVVSGNIRVIFDGETFVAGPREFILIDCKKPHVYQALGQAEFRYFHFDGNKSSELYSIIEHKHGHHIRQSQQSNIENAITKLISLAYDGYVNEFRISAQIHYILSELISSDPENEQSKESVIARSIMYIENNFATPILIDDIASEVGLSPYYFSRLFRKYTNLSPHEYLINLRITFALDILSSSDRSIEDISEMSGYSSVQHFIRSFKQKVGCSPLQYRKQTSLYKNL